VKVLKILLLSIFCISLLSSLNADSILPKKGFKLEDLDNIKAKNWTVIDKNITASGGVVIPFKDMELAADKAIINSETGDIEAVGNISLTRKVKVSGSVTLAMLNKLQKRRDTIVKISSIDGDVFGNQQINVNVSFLAGTISCNRLIGNLNTGYFKFDQLQITYSTFIAKAKSGERLSDGIINLNDATISNCEYLANNNEHYSIGAKKIRLVPNSSELYTLDRTDKEFGDYTVFMFNSIASIYGVPVLWLPVFYKSRDENPSISGFHWGKNSDLGFFVNLYKKFRISDAPDTTLKVLTDIFSKRGIGLGARLEVKTENSNTEIFGYAIHDKKPYQTDNYDNYRLEVPKERYDFRISNITHITPRLDFRANLDIQSDYYVKRDFFEDLFNIDPQPASYAALEQQFDNFSSAILVQPKVNSFYTTVERLPEVRLDIPRQQLLNSNFYYQGDISGEELKMNWTDFDISRDKVTNRRFAKLHNYDSFRFITTHLVYYPLKWDFLNIIPRAGFKVISYSNSSKNKVRTDDLLTLLNESHPESLGLFNLDNYDNKGDSKTRGAFEVGVEFSTKIHRTWQDIKNATFELDGLRHIIKPYINATSMNVAGDNKSHIYYFDDIDRIEKQNFVRFGLVNTLHTRSENKLKEFMRLENFWDLHAQKEDGFAGVEEFSQVGDFCSILTANPIKGLTLVARASADLGNNNGSKPDIWRRDRNVGSKGHTPHWINQWNLRAIYSPDDDLTLETGYNYNRKYATRSAYSIGSTLTQFNGGSFFENVFYDKRDEIYVGAKFPLTNDRKTIFGAKATFDINDGHWNVFEFILSKRFHCFELKAGLAFEYDDDEDAKNWDVAYSIQARLTGLEAPMRKKHNQALTMGNPFTNSSIGTPSSTRL
jgi:lipopolysaccharide assembly outer membrane protein LptD (OstA)